VWTALAAASSCPTDARSDALGAPQPGKNFAQTKYSVTIVELFSSFSTKYLFFEKKNDKNRQK
jgi:hypothetical protein